MQIQLNCISLDAGWKQFPPLWVETPAEGAEARAKEYKRCTEQTSEDKRVQPVWKELRRITGYGETVSLGVTGNQQRAGKSNQSFNRFDIWVLSPAGGSLCPHSS